MSSQSFYFFAITCFATQVSLFSDVLKLHVTPTTPMAESRVNSAIPVVDATMLPCFGTRVHFLLPPQQHTNTYIIFYLHSSTSTSSMDAAYEYIIFHLHSSPVFDASQHAAGTYFDVHAAPLFVGPASTFVLGSAYAALDGPLTLIPDAAQDGSLGTDGIAATVNGPPTDDSRTELPCHVSPLLASNEASPTYPAAGTPM